MDSFVLEIEKRIVRDPEILRGKPTIKGTRISVQLIVEFMANGISETEIVDDYPQLTDEDVRAALAYYLRAVAEHGEHVVAAPRQD
jgi:uncharacterized protein (DUF433 family)